MNTYRARIALLGLAAVLVLAVGMPLGAADADPAVQKTFDKLLDAIKANDRDAFVADATDAVKKATTKEVMDFLDKELGSRLKKGYKATYLCDLKIAKHQVHLWKLTFKDGGDDMVLRIALKDGKIDGFFLQ